MFINPYLGPAYKTPGARDVIMNPETSRSDKNIIKMFIAGAQKAGTTSLKHYLGEHPEITTHHQKEFAYFYDDQEFNAGLDAAFKKYFDSNTEGKNVIAKNAGLYVKEKGIKRLYDHNPDCQIVLILRNPVERAYSAYQMEKNYGNVSGNFGELKSLILNGQEEDWRYEFFIKMGMYVDYLQTIYSYFPKEQVSLFRFEDLTHNPTFITTQLFEKLRVDSAFVPNVEVKYNVTRKMRSAGYGRLLMKLLQNNNPIKKVARKIIPARHDYKIGEMLRNANKSSDRPEQITSEMRHILEQFYAPYNNELSKVTGLDFSIWNRTAAKA